jgi:hypothetical protein
MGSLRWCLDGDHMEWLRYGKANAHPIEENQRLSLREAKEYWRGARGRGSHPLHRGRCVAGARRRLGSNHGRMRGGIAKWWRSRPIEAQPVDKTQLFALSDAPAILILMSYAWRRTHRLQISIETRTQFAAVIGMADAACQQPMQLGAGSPDIVTRPSGQTVKALHNPFTTAQLTFTPDHSVGLARSS